MTDLNFPCPYDPRILATGPSAKSEYGPCPSVWLCGQRGCQRRPMPQFDSLDPLRPPFVVTSNVSQTRGPDKAVRDE